MHAGNPALACTLCFYLPAKTNFVFCQQSDQFPIMRNISAQPPQFPARLPQFPGSKTFLNSQTNFLPSRPNFWAAENFRNNEPYSQQKKSNCSRKICEQKETKMIFYRYNTRLSAAY